MATEVIAGDLSASLSIYLANELTATFSNTFSHNEIILFAMAILAMSTWLRALVEELHGISSPFYQTVTKAFYDLFRTVAYLSAAVVVQLSVMLVRSSIDLPLARIITVMGTLLLMKIVLNALTLDRHPLDAQTRLVGNNKLSR